MPLVLPPVVWWRLWWWWCESREVDLASHTRQPRMTEAQARSLHAHPLATCLDGSAARYYIRPADPRRFLIFFEGWGFCSSMADCQARSATPEGSSLEYPPSLKLDRYYFQHGASNPILGGYTAVFVRTCDGGYFSGARRDPIPYNGTLLHFRGRWIIEALISDLHANFALSRVEEIVWGGCSAGGIHVLAHLDYLRTLAPPAARVSGFVDSGFYMDVAMYSDLKRFVTSPDGMNASMMLNAACIADHPAATHLCLIGEISSRYVLTPTFVWQSAFDHDQRDCEMPTSCASSINCVAAYADNLTVAVQTWVDESSHLQHGAFLDACDRHCDDGFPPPLYAPGIRTHEGVSPLQAFAQWHRGVSARKMWRQAEMPSQVPIRCTAAHHPSSLLAVEGVAAPTVLVGVVGVVVVAMAAAIIGCMCKRRHSTVRLRHAVQPTCGGEVDMVTPLLRAGWRLCRPRHRAMPARETKNTTEVLVETPHV